MKLVSKSIIKAQVEVIQDPTYAGFCRKTKERPVKTQMEINMEWKTISSKCNFIEVGVDSFECSDCYMTARRTYVFKLSKIPFEYRPITDAVEAEFRTRKEAEHAIDRLNQIIKADIGNNFTKRLERIIKQR